jgi:hypothetical protein
MRKIFLSAVWFLIITVMLISSCSKEIVGRTDNTAPLNPTNIDLNAGAWKPILITAPTDVAIAVPIATNTPEYLLTLRLQLMKNPLLY